MQTDFAKSLSPLVKGLCKVEVEDCYGGEGADTILTLGIYTNLPSTGSALNPSQAHHYMEWEKITCDKVILDYVKAYSLEFTELPRQTVFPRQLNGK